MSSALFIRPITRELANLTPLTPTEIDRVSGGDDSQQIDDPVTVTYTKLQDGTLVISDWG